MPKSLSSGNKSAKKKKKRTLKPTPEMLGSGLARDAARALRSRDRRIRELVDNI